MDYATSLQKIRTDNTFSCARTMCESVVTNVYALWALEELKKELKSVNFVTVSCDTSHLKHMKLLLILVYYCQVCELETPVKNKFLTFVEISGENGDTISTQMMKAVASYGKDTKVVGLSADNTNSNF
jgi:hypothetical protein